MAASAKVPHPSTCKGRGCEHEEMPVNSSPGNGAGDSCRTGGAAPRTGGEGEEVRHGIRHPPQLAGSLEVSTHFPKQNICPTGQCWPCAFAANCVTRETDQQRRA